MGRFSPVATSLLVVNTIFTFLAIVAVILRFYSSHLINRRTHMSDYLVVAGMVSSWAVLGTGYGMVFKGGAGLHFFEATPIQRTNMLKLFIAAPAVWAISMTFLKLSILAFYHKVFATRNFRIAVYVASFLVTVLFLFAFISPFILCRPLAYNWDKTIEGGECSDIISAYVGVAVANTIIDLGIFCLPLPLLWRLQMATRKKIACSAIFLIGLVVCIISALRVHALVELNLIDFTYDIVADANYAALEMEIATINACLPFYRPLFTRYFPNSPFSTKKNALSRTWDFRHPITATEKGGYSYGGERAHPISRDPYPLDTVHSNTVTSHSYAFRDSQNLVSVPENAFHPDQHITVNHTIDVQYSPK